MQTLNDYLPLFIGLVSAIIGIRGNTWNDNKTGFDAITKWGYFAIFLALIAFVTAIRTIEQKNEEISDVQKIRGMLNKEIVKSIRGLIIPFIRMDFKISKNDSSAIDFKVIRDTNTIAKLFISELMINKKRDLGIVEQQYVRDSIEIVKGEAALRDILQVYASLMDVKTVIAIQDILNDDFLKTKYAFRDKWTKMLLKSANKRINNQNLPESERNAPGGTRYGPYYSSPDIEHENLTKYDDLLRLTAKIERLYKHVKYKKP